MRWALALAVVLGGCGGYEYSPPPDVKGAWLEVFGREDLAPSLWSADGPEMEHRQGMEVALVRDLSAAELAHALTHVWMIRAVRERPDAEQFSDAWNGDPNHVGAMWLQNGQSAALEKAALDYLRAH